MMIWTLEAAPPWRVTAVDRDRDSTQDPFLDTIGPDDRGAGASALATVTTQGSAECACRVAMGPSVSASGHLDLVGISARNGERQIVAIWKSDTGDAREVPRVVDDQTMRQFLGQVSHDLRTPLNGVLGMTRLLLDSGLRADQVDYARAIDTSG